MGSVQSKKHPLLLHEYSAKQYAERNEKRNPSNKSQKATTTPTEQRRAHQTEAEDRLEVEINHTNKKNYMKTVKNLLSRMNVFGRIRNLEREVHNANQLALTVAQAHNVIAERTQNLLDHAGLVEVQDKKRGVYLRKKRTNKKNDK